MTQNLLGKQTETFILNTNAELTFDNLKNLRAIMLCPKLYRKAEFLRGKGGVVGSVQYQEFLDQSRSYEVRIIGIDEYKKKLTLETVDYKEPFSHECTCQPIKHQDSEHLKKFHTQASKRIVKLQVLELTNPILEDEIPSGAPERCFVKWTTHISNDSHTSMSQIEGIEHYKKMVISNL